MPEEDPDNGADFDVLEDTDAAREDSSFRNVPGSHRMGFMRNRFFLLLTPPQLLDRNPPKNPLFLEGIELGKVVGKNEVLCGVGPSIAAMAEFQKLLTRHIPLFLASSEVCSFATAGVYLL